MEVIDYPTGMRVERERMERGVVRLDIERVLIVPALALGCRVDDVTVSGTVRTGRGVMDFESLPVRNFRSLGDARTYARRALSRVQA